MLRHSKFRKPDGVVGTLLRGSKALLAARRKLATGAAAVLALGLGYHVVFGHNGLTAYRQKMHDTEAMDAQKRSLERENDLLKGHVDRLQNDPNAIEHQAREELHYTRPGEVIYTLPVSADAAGAATRPVAKP